MPSLFPEWSNTAIRAALLALVATIVAVPTALMIYMRTPDAWAVGLPPDQPIEFDHRHHVRDDGIDCLYCHRGAEVSDVAQVPPTSTCMGCHNQVWNESPLIEPVRRSWFTGAPIPWNRVHDLPDHVYFNHAIHVNKGIGCVTCHGRVDQMARVYKVAAMNMAWCLECHRSPEPHLRPLDRITDMEWTPPFGEEGARLREELARRYGVRRLTNCTTCHR